MATGGSNEIDDLLQCPICLEMFLDPKVLDCQHTFCSQCLKIYTARTIRQSSIECPLCRRKTNLLNNSVDQLPSNYIVADIINRKYGQRNGEQRPNSYAKQVEERLKKLQMIKDQEKDPKKDEDSVDYMQYLKPAAAALVGVLGGLLLAKGVQKATDRKDRR